jgi:hypothetical protein
MIGNSVTTRAMPREPPSAKPPSTAGFAAMRCSSSAESLWDMFEHFGELAPWFATLTLTALFIRFILLETPTPQVDENATVLATRSTGSTG